MTADELKAWRKKNGHTQETLAHALRVIPLTISRWEREVRGIPPFLFLALEALERRGGEEAPKGTNNRKED